MSSLKMTFSLTSLILLMAFVAMPAMAHDGHTDAHPTVTIEAALDSAYTTTDVKARDNFKVKVTFSIGGSTDSDQFTTALLTDGDLSFSGFAANGAPVSGTVAQVKTTLTDFTTTRVAADKHEWIVPVQIDSASVRTLRVQVGANVVTGANIDSQQANEVKAVDIAMLPPALDLAATLEATQVKDAQDMAIPGRYKLTLTLKKGTDAATDAQVTTLPTLSDIIVMPEGAAAPATGVTDFTHTADSGVYTANYQLTFGVTDVTFSLISGYATDAPSATIDLDAVVPDPKTSVNPTVGITLVSHDEVMKSFQVLFAFVEATVDTATETAGAVPATLMSADIAVTKSGTDADGMAAMVDAVIPDPEVESLRGAGQWVVTIDYSFDPDGLPLHVTLANRATVSAINGEMVADLMAADPTPALMVGMEAPPPTTNNAPVVAITTTAPATAVATGSFAVMYSATDADTDDAVTVTATLDAASMNAGYTVSTPANGMVTITQPTADATTPNIPAATVTVTITANDGTVDSAAMTLAVMFAGRTHAPDDVTDPVVAVVPVAGAKSEAFDVTFTVTEANLAIGGVTAAITPAGAVEDAAPAATLVSGNTYKITITPKAATATIPTVAAATIAITVTATDVAGNSSSQSIAVSLGERTYTPMPTDTTAPTVAVTPVVGAQSAAFDVTITATDNIDTLTAANISVTDTSSNTGAATYTVSAVTAGTVANTYKVTITPTAATTADIAEETLTISVTVTDAAGNSASQSIAVALAARTMTHRDHQLLVLLVQVYDATTGESTNLIGSRSQRTVLLLLNPQIFPILKSSSRIGGTIGVD